VISNRNSFRVLFDKIAFVLQTNSTCIIFIILTFFKILLIATCSFFLLFIVYYAHDADFNKY